MTKKILIINKYCPLHPKAGGAEKRLLEIFSRIGKKHKIYLLSAMFPGAKKRQTYKNINIIRLGRKNSENTIRIHFSIIFCLWYYLKKIKPDILYEDISVIPFFTPIFHPFQKKQIIIHHLNQKHFFESQRFIYAIIGYLAEAIFILLYKKQKVIVVSNWMKKKLENYNFKYVKKILNGVDQSLISEKKYSIEPTVLFLGRLEGRKGINLFLKTYPLVKKSIENVKYIIAGDGSEKIEQESNKLHQKKNIQFLGFVSEEKKKELFQKCWLYVTPSKIEGYGISVLEANATGTFVLANDVEGLQESVKNNETGELLDCENTGLFADKIITWLNKEELRQKEKNCRAWAKFHNWNKAVQETETALF
ncbi:glycosyltransferase family 4 protein [Patescibacteria group bacterium]|nr:glycosyltransferase family 4 protein [Patescibacteria group bacterium]